MGYIIIDLEFNNLKNINKYYKNFLEEHNELKDIELENEIIDGLDIRFVEHMKEIFDVVFC